MIVPERPVPFSKSRLFSGAFLGASRTTETLKVGSFIGIKAYNVAAR
jgi:hypothetical protein